MPVTPHRHFRTAAARAVRARVAWCALAAAAVCAAASGCGLKAKDAQAAPIPPLIVPDAPPRELPPVEDVALVVAPVPPEGPITSSTSPPEAPAVPGRTQAPEPRRETTAPPAAGAANPAPLEPSRDVRPGRGAEELAEIKRIEDVLRTANNHLDRVELPRLSISNKEQYDDAKQYIETANRAIKERRLSYAAANADKALTIALQLVPR